MKLLSISNPWKFAVAVLVGTTPSWTHLLVQGTNTELVQYCLPDDDDSFDTQDVYCEHTSRSTGSPHDQGASSSSTNKTSFRSRSVTN